MLIDGITSIPFSAMTLDSPKVTNDLSAAIVGVSREKYGTQRKQVEESIHDWYNVDSVIAGVNANEKDDPIVVANNNVKKDSDRDRDRNKDRGESDKSATPKDNNNLKDALHAAMGSNGNDKKAQPPAQVEAKREEKKPEPVKQGQPDKQPQPEQIKQSQPQQQHQHHNDKADIKKALEKAMSEKTKEETQVKLTPKEEPVRVEAHKLSEKKEPQLVPDKKVTITPPNIVRHESPKREERDYKKIDKNTLRDIIKDSARPKERPHEERKEKVEATVKATPKPQEIKEAIKEVKPVEVVHNERVYPDTKEKEISLEDFYNLKAIHPHEKIQIKKDTQEIKPGEVVKF